ncbi:MAG: hypothetical protein WC829_02820 [Hyphomicrobium sp.]
MKIKTLLSDFDLMRAYGNGLIRSAVKAVVLARGGRVFVCADKWWR